MAVPCVNVESGELEYLDPAKHTVDDALYTGSATVAEVYCTTCHAVTDANDPHRTGIPWTAWLVPVRGAGSERTQARSLRRAPRWGSVTGTSAGDMGPANTCVWCHKSRKDVTQYVTATGNKLLSVLGTA
jgi:hypothetical protein